MLYTRFFDRVQHCRNCNGVYLSKENEVVVVICGALLKKEVVNNVP